MPPLRLTRHASVRWRQRIGGRPVLASAVRLPRRLAALRWPRLASSEWARLWLTPRAVLLVRGRRCVVTVVRATVEDLATVLAWMLTGWWFAEEAT